MNSVSFAVPFVMGKARPLVTSRGTFTPSRTRRAEEAIRAAYTDACPGPYPTFGEGPVAVIVVTSRALPKSRPKRVEIEPDTFKPDADNVAKLVCDALNGVAWRDDAQVTRLNVVKGPRQRTACEETRVVVMREGVYTK